MKTLLTIILVLSVSLILPVSVMAQTGKHEQKIKIITNDGSGNKVILDTLITGTNGPDSLRLKDGSVIYLKRDGDMTEWKHNKNNGQFFITSSANSDNNGAKTKEITIITSDSLDNDMVIRKSHNGYKYRVITRNSDGSDEERDNVIYVKKKHDGSVYVDNDNDSDKSRYVIAKDGVVVTVESTDDARAKEIAKEIENKLGVNSENGKDSSLKKSKK